jgi:hypothetical protein
LVGDGVGCFGAGVATLVGVLVTAKIKIMVSNLMMMKIFFVGSILHVFCQNLTKI